MAKAISDLTPTTLQSGDEVEIYRPGAPTSELRAPLVIGSDVGELLQIVDVEGNAGLPVLDGRNLTNVEGASAPTPSVVTITGTTHTLGPSEQAHFNVLLAVDNGNQNCAITMPDDSAIGAWRIRSKTTGTVTVQRETSGTINGGVSGTLVGPGREAKLEVYATPGGVAEASWEGETGEPTVQDSEHDANDQVIHRAELRDISETVVAKGTFGSGAISFDYTAGGYQWGTTGAGNITSVAITNPPASGKLGCITLEFVQGATPRTITWGSAFRFPGGTDFTLTASIGAIDIFTFMTRDGGTTWRGYEGGKAFA